MRSIILCFWSINYANFVTLVRCYLVSSFCGLTVILVLTLHHFSLSDKCVPNTCIKEVLARFKACVRYFLSSFYFSLNDNPLKTIKNVFLFHLKSSFRSRDIQVFVFSFSRLFLAVSHCFRGRSKKNLMTSSIVTHFVWYLEKE